MSADELAAVVAELGALPMPVPVVPEPKRVDAGPVVLPMALAEAQLDALAASGNRAVNDAVHEDLCACDAWPKECLSSGGFFQGYWDMGGLDTAIPAVLGLWERMRGGELAAFRALELGDLDGRVSASCGKPNHLTWLRKVDDTRACPWCVMELQNDSLVARTHQLAHYQEIERNFWANQRADESLAAVANRRIAELNERIAELEALTPARVQTCRVCGAGYTYGEPCSSCEFRTRMAAELQARGLGGEHEAAVHHSYRVGRDLPEGGLQ